MYYVILVYIIMNATHLFDFCCQSILHSKSQQNEKLFQWNFCKQYLQFISMLLFDLRTNTLNIHCCDINTAWNCSLNNNEQKLSTIPQLDHSRKAILYTVEYKSVVFCKCFAVVWYFWTEIQVCFDFSEIKINGKKHNIYR